MEMTMKALLVLSLLASMSWPEVSKCQTQSVNANWQEFLYSSLLMQHKDKQRPYLRFLDRPSMNMGLYVLPAGAIDEQTPHDLDEVYYVVTGRGTLTVAGDKFEVTAGSIIYVKAEVPHRFSDIEEDLQVLVVFPKGVSSTEDPAWQAFNLTAIRSHSSPDENIWHPFLKVKTMRFGLYMLPQEVGGDQKLTHVVDEVNIVTRGTAKFRMGEDEIEVGPGSIVWVRQGVGHYFHTLSTDFDVLILFESGN